MTNARRAYSEAETVALLSQVSNRCPLCDGSLFYKKKLRHFKSYELAHIYPLNPSPTEITELAGLPLLSSDVNDPDNIVPLCLNCHGQYDKPRTAGEYSRLYQIKSEALQDERQRALASQYPLDRKSVV